MLALNHERDTHVNTKVMQDQHVITTVITIAERLRYAREKIGLTQTQLAAKAAVTQSAISNLENGTRKRPRDLVNIARALNIDPAWLESGKQDVYTRAHAATAATVEEPTQPYAATSTAIQQALSVIETALTQLDMQGRERIAPLFESFARAPGPVIKKDIAEFLQDLKNSKSHQKSLTQKGLKTG